MRREASRRRFGSAPVILGDVRNDDLCVALGAERAALKQRLGEEDAAAVDVETRLRRWCASGLDRRERRRGSRTWTLSSALVT